MLEHTLLVCNTTDDEVHQDIEQPPGDGVRPANGTQPDKRTHLANETIPPDRIPSK